MFLPVARRAGTGRREPHQLPPGRHGLPRAFVVENQRERILSAVGDVVSVAGYRDMSVEDVIVTAGVSRRTFYEHFKNKEDAFLAAYDAVLLQLLSLVQSAIDAEQTVPGPHASGAERLPRLPGARARLRADVHRGGAGGGPEAIARRNGAMTAFATLISENAHEIGTPLEPPPLTAETIVGGIYEVVYTRIVRGDIRQLPELLADLLYPALLPFEGKETAVAEYKRVKGELTGSTK